MSALQPIRASVPGVEITACRHGAHLMTWTTDGTERLWMSPVSNCGEATALRGGVPLLFPQFGGFGPLPKHGFARSVDWRQIAPSSEDGRANLAFELHDTVSSRHVWPHPFRAVARMSASATDLVISLEVTNLDEYDAHFTAGLHTYLAVAESDDWVEGLAGLNAWDGVDTVHPNFDQPVSDHVLALEERDMAVHDVTGPVVLHDRVLGDLVITAEGFPDRVVWNPGPGQRLPDVPNGMEADFVCIEPVTLTQVTLPSGATWTGSQRIAVA